MTQTVEPAPLSRPRLARHARLRWDEARQKHVLLAPEGLLLLNRTGAAILELCDGERSVADIAAALAEEYTDVEATEIAAFLGGLVSRRLLEVSGGG